MYQYLSTVTADYNYTLVLRNQKVMPESGEKSQRIHSFDDGGISVTRLSDSSFFEVKLQFDVVSTADSAVVYDLYNSTSKANGSANTFYWQHPVTLKYYTVRFMDIVTKTYNAGWGDLLTVNAFTLRIEGNKPA